MNIAYRIHLQFLVQSLCRNFNISLLFNTLWRHTFLCRKNVFFCISSKTQKIKIPAYRYRESKISFQIRRIDTEGFNTMMRNTLRHGLSNRLPYRQGHILSHEQGLFAIDYTHTNVNRFINGVGLRRSWYNH